MGTVAAQSLVVTVDRASDKLGLAAGSTVTLAVGGTGQTVRVNVQACTTSTGSATQLSVRGLELKVQTVCTDTATTTGKKHEEEHGDHHEGGTTTTAATTTTARTTTTTRYRESRVRGMGRLISRTPPADDARARAVFRPHAQEGSSE